MRVLILLGDQETGKHYNDFVYCDYLRLIAISTKGGRFWPATYRCYLSQSISTHVTSASLKKCSGPQRRDKGSEMQPGETVENYLGDEQRRVAELFMPNVLRRSLEAIEAKRRFVHYSGADAAMSMLRSKQVWMV
jgi:hypothetical protein